MNINSHWRVNRVAGSPGCSQFRQWKSEVLSMVDRGEPIARWAVGTILVAIEGFVFYLLLLWFNA